MGHWGFTLYRVVCQSQRVRIWAVHLGADTWASPCTALCVKANVCIFGSLLFCSGDIALGGGVSCAALCVKADVCDRNGSSFGCEVRFLRTVSFTNSGQCFAFPQPSTMVTCISGMCYTRNFLSNIMDILLIT